MTLMSCTNVVKDCSAPVRHENYTPDETPQSKSCILRTCGSFRAKSHGRSSVFLHPEISAWTRNGPFVSFPEPRVPEMELY